MKLRKYCKRLLSPPQTSHRKISQLSESVLGYIEWRFGKSCCFGGRLAGEESSLKTLRFRKGLASFDENSHEPLTFLMSQERQKSVRSALERMSERDRQLLLLKYVEGFSYSQIAERVGVSASAVQSRLHRARAALRSELKDCLEV